MAGTLFEAMEVRVLVSFFCKRLSLHISREMCKMYVHNVCAKVCIKAMYFTLLVKDVSSFKEVMGPNRKNALTRRCLIIRHLKISHHPTGVMVLQHHLGRPNLVRDHNEGSLQDLSINVWLDQ